MVWAAAGNLPEQNQNNKCVNRPPRTAVKKYAGTYDLPCTNFLCLTDEMVHTIIGLKEELVRWRQILIKYLPPEWAEGLQSDILNNISRDFEGNPAYNLYVSMVCSGIDPQHGKERLDRTRRLINGTNETIIKYL